MVRAHGIYVDRVKTIKGFYSESLTRALRRKYVDSGRKISLVNIDCDLYESATPVFDFIDPLLQEGTSIYIDDLFAGYKGHPHKGSRALSSNGRSVRAGKSYGISTLGGGDVPTSSIWIRKGSTAHCERRAGNFYGAILNGIWGIDR